MFIDKLDIIAILRSRGLDARADWVDREFDRDVDVKKNDSLLRMLNIDPATLTTTEVAREAEPA